MTYSSTEVHRRRLLLGRRWFQNLRYPGNGRRRRDPPPSRPRPPPSRPRPPLPPRRHHKLLYTVCTKILRNVGTSLSSSQDKFIQFNRSYCPIQVHSMARDCQHPAYFYRKSTTHLMGVSVIALTNFQFKFVSAVISQLTYYTDKFNLQLDYTDKCNR